EARRHAETAPRGEERARERSSLDTAGPSEAPRERAAGGSVGPEANPPQGSSEEPASTRALAAPEARQAPRSAPTKSGEDTAEGAAPTAVAPGGAQPQQPAPDYDVVAVFYGTDRERKMVGDRPHYGAERARRLELGRAQVTIPKSHEVPVIERPF